MTIFRILSIAALCAVSTPALAGPASAGEVFVGLAAHEVNTPFTLKTYESGVDVQFGYRSRRIEALRIIGRPSTHIFGSINSAGDTHLVAAGLNWKLGKTIFVRPGIGLAVHDGPIPRNGPAGRRTDLGSRILFEPEIAIGYQVSDKLTVEASWVHISNATLLSGQNPGLDMIGRRLSFRL
jgi:lipid A 3-O-deacylase